MLKILLWTIHYLAGWGIFLYAYQTKLLKKAMTMLENDKQSREDERERTLNERVPALQVSGLSLQDLQVYNHWSIWIHILFVFVLNKININHLTVQKLHTNMFFHLPLFLSSCKQLVFFLSFFLVSFCFCAQSTGKLTFENLNSNTKNNFSVSQNNWHTSLSTVFGRNFMKHFQS